MLQPELKLRRDKIRALMVQQDIDAALITCNVNLIYTYGRVVSGYLYLPLNAPARLFLKRPNDIEGEHIHSIRKPEQISELLKEYGLPLPTKLMLEGDELPFTDAQYQALTTLTRQLQMQFPAMLTPISVGDLYGQLPMIFSNIACTTGKTSTSRL